MPTDVHGQHHAGSLGLFDDDAENDNAIARAERHEHDHLESVIRRHKRREKRQFRKDQKAAERAAQGKSKLPWPISWVGKLFGGGKDLSPDAGRVPESARSEYVIVRRPETPEPVYTGEDVDPVDSPWLRECGMVRVKSDDPGGCHIVPKSVIQKNQ
ncbi:uncharacterized protein K460DRAFT_327680 [Cucurbitaria berberidis CBS 394.84]|uniref:Uncharacterized protein n=1 Tax=Cucurbitaria berberidis CBS 394.84 TaxID=1168544 RepID=A0A9P4GQ37_9PLEO|nr:uncharacterized protein K460DRAFT_327680 [Cucurbitaria berberidis CBS 394.84]KAF1850623.1 hypothetical protein K460DRAFT_327680 [Cucurbitaria berberidis CBS 394.84]